MRTVIQRVQKSQVRVNGQVVGKIGRGLLVLLGVTSEDSMEDVEYLVQKIINLRVFTDKNGKMNLSLRDISGELLVVSQFTLYGDCRRGRRPSYSGAASPELAKELYHLFVSSCKASGINVEQGVFAAHMEVELVNDGPVTLLLDSSRLF